MPDDVDEPQDKRAKWRARWPHIRGALILAHVVAVLLLGFPAPAGVMARSAWKEPSVQNEMRIWVERSRLLGFTWSQEEFEDFLWDFSKSFLKVRRTVLKPFRPYTDYLGTRQDWRMFSAPHRWPVRLHIDVRIDGRWEEVYAGRSDEKTWNRERLDHHRLRRIVFLHSWRKYRGRYKTFCRWLARLAAEDFPEADRIRVRQYKFRTPTPEERRAGKVALEGKWQNRRELDLEKYR